MVLNFKGVITRLMIVDLRVLTGSLYTVPDVQRLFIQHRLEWIDKSLGSFSVEIVWEFYTSYVVTL